MKDVRDDEALVTAWGEGDERAFEALYERSMAYVLTIARDRARPGDVEDIAQAAWAHVIRYVGGKSPTLKFKKFVQLSTIAAASAFYRYAATADGGPTMRPSPENWARIASATAAPEADLFRGIDMDMVLGRVRACLAGTDRLLFESVFACGKTLREAGAEIGIGHEAVRQRILVIRNRVKKRVGVSLPRSTKALRPTEPRKKYR